MMAEEGKEEAKPSNPLTSLPSDALISILCRVPARDHDALRNTSKLLRTTLDSDAYASERAISGWVEVEARLVPGEELYDRENPNGPDMYGDDDDSYYKELCEREEDNHDDSKDDDDTKDDNVTEEERIRNEARKKRWEDKCATKRKEEIETYYSNLGSCDECYKYENITVDIKIDGVDKVGQVDLVLIPRRLDYPFHSATDAHSGEMQNVGWTLCDSRGRPKVRSIKEADTDGNAKFGGLLHVSEVKIPQKYKTLDTTNVVARALRAALTVPELNGKWTLATATCDCRVYMTDEDLEMKRFVQRSNARGCYGGGEMKKDEEVAKKKQFSVRYGQCMNMDARTFARVGYRQIPEVVGTKKDEPKWFWAFPSYLREPIMSHEEAMGLELFEPPDLPPEPTGWDEELFNTVKTACNYGNGHYGPAALIDNQLKQLEKQMRINWEQEEKTIADYQDSVARFQEMESVISDIENQPQLPEEVATMINANRTEMERHRKEMDSLRGKIDELKRKHNASTFEQICAEKMNELKREKQAIIDKDNEDLKDKVTTLVNNKGASIRNSYVLHCSARFLLTEYIDFLLELVPANERKAAINDLDTNGGTPLHCMVMGTPELNNVEKYYSAVQHLLKLGADTSIVDIAGRTPLGQYREVNRYRSDFHHAFGCTEKQDQLKPIHLRMEEALTPIGGETEADKDAKDNRYAQLDFDDMDFDEEEDD